MKKSKIMIIFYKHRKDFELILCDKDGFRLKMSDGEYLAPFFDYEANRNN